MVPKLGKEDNASELCQCLKIMIFISYGNEEVDTSSSAKFVSWFGFKVLYRCKRLEREDHSGSGSRNALTLGMTWKSREFIVSVSFYRIAIFNSFELNSYYCAFQKAKKRILKVYFLLLRFTKMEYEKSKCSQRRALSVLNANYSNINQSKADLNYPSVCDGKKSFYQNISKNHAANDGTKVGSGTNYEAQKENIIDLSRVKKEPRANIHILERDVEQKRPLTSESTSNEESNTKTQKSLDTSGNSIASEDTDRELIENLDSKMHWDEDSGELPPSLTDLIFKPKPNKISRPPNAFMLFAKEHRRQVGIDHPAETNRQISTLLGNMWRDLSSEEKIKYYKEAQALEKLHKETYPKIRKLLIGEELGDRRPSELLRVMRRRAESHSVPDDLMLELFQQHLPTRVQSILAAISPLTLEKAAEVADRVMEVTQLRNSRRLFIRDRRTNVTFLIDTGSDVSIIPATKTQRQNNSQMTLSAANTSPIHVYTTQTLSLDLGLRRIFQWTFLVGNSRIHSIKTVSGDSVYHELLRKFPDITKPPRPDQEIKHSVVHYIETNSRPVTAKARRLAPDRLRIAKAEFENMITLGHMRPSKSNYASPLHMVPKKDSTEWRPVGDYRALNAQTIKDNYSVPNILGFTSNLHGTKIYSHIDLVKVYHQIPINPDDVHKSAIITPFGLFESTRMQFDDILVASSSPEEHLQHLQILFTRLQQYGLSLKPSKCIFGVTSIKFLGFKVSESGIEPLSDRVDCILNFPQPTTLTQLRRFLGLFNFYRRFVPKAAHLLAPLNKFLEGIKNFKKSKKFPVKICVTQFNGLRRQSRHLMMPKNALADATLLRHPIPGAKLSLWTDASEKAVGGSLMQLCQNNLGTCCLFVSKTVEKSAEMVHI
ncbi:hypothetical protein TNCV_3012961 [Trichonephila clavipes]|nr:hypothetical protein TNCV_3012961 [Trichonephila clavipes]